jgi:uncharacterized protein YndB with AHSA1/START domain
VPRSTRQIMIDRPAEEVFAFVSDPTHDPQWHDTILEVTPTSEPPLRCGGTFTAVYRPQGASETYDLVGEMTAYEPGRSSELKALFAEPRGRVPEMIGCFVLTFRVEAEGPRTRLTRGVEIRGGALRYRLLWRLLAPLWLRSGRARQDELLGRIKTILESATPPRGASPDGIGAG